MRQGGEVTHRAQFPRRSRARSALLAAATLIAVAGITVLVFGQQIIGASPTSAGSHASPSASPASAATLAALLRQGTQDTASGYWEKTNANLKATAAGEDDARFRALGVLLVKDGFADAILNLGREMTGGWYNWDVRSCPRTEPDCFVSAWRHIVDAMRSVPGEHFRFLWTVFPGTAAAMYAWPGAAYVNLIGTDIYDWYGGPDYTYPHTKSGQLDYNAKWQQILTQTEGLDWIARLSQLTGEPIAIPEWGLDFHSFGGQDDPAFITRMLTWLHAHHAIGVYWALDHVTSDQAVPPGPLLAGLGADAGSPAGMNGFGQLLGGRLQYAEVPLPEDEPVSDSSAQPVLAPWEQAGFQLILSVPMVPLTVPTYNGPPEPAGKPPYQLADYPNALAAFRQGISSAGS
jgi:hypothetical protein